MIQVKMPFLGANDDNALIAHVYFRNGASVSADDLLVSVETTKSVFDVESESNGYFYSNIKIGERKNYGEIIGFISPSPLEKEDILAYFKGLEPKKSDTKKITKKAEILIAKNNINVDKLLLFAKNEDINEGIIIQFLKKRDSKIKQIGMNHSIERVAILGGVTGGGALIIIDSIIRNSNQAVVCIFDNDQSTHGKRVLGIPVLGFTYQVEKSLELGEFDSVIIAFNSNLYEREKVFLEMKGKNISFTNVIDPSADIRTGVEIGEGNVILANTYIAACTIIGDNNFISSNVCLEHGNQLGSHNAFGPGVFTSGNVIMKNKIRFGTGVFVEPSLTIGNKVTLGSFVLVSKDIGDNSIIKRKQDYIVQVK